MKKLVILLVLLAFCLPAYAADPNAILVYKVSGKLTGIDITAEEAVKIKFRAYLVMEVDYSGADPNVLVDDALILYGDDAEGDYDVDTYYNAINISGDFVQSPINGKLAWGIFADACDLLVLVTGKAKARKIGSADKEVVAKSMKGSGICNDWLIHYGNDVIVSGKVKLRLSSKLTKAANEDNVSFTDTVAAIEAAVQ